VVAGRRRRSGACDHRAGAGDGRAAGDRRGLDGAAVRVSVLDVDDHGDAARGRLRIVWRVPAIGRFGYDTRATLRRAHDAWKVLWQPTVVHPALVDGRRLGTSVERPGRADIRADILDRAGRPIVTERAVVRVGVARDRVRDVDATARAVAEVADVDARAYARAIRRAGPRSSSRR